jgi:hypothetical protein
MLSSGVILALGGTLLLVVADNVPSLNVEPACRAAAKMGDSSELWTPRSGNVWLMKKALATNWRRNGRNSRRHCASVASPPRRPAATPAMSKCS